MIKKVMVAMAFLAVTACGEREVDESDLLSEAARLLVGTNPSAPVRRQASVPEDELLGNPGKYLRVNVRDLSVWDTMVAAGENGARTTWLGASGISVTIEDGVVVATRGLPRDLMGADVTQTVRAIGNGGGSSVRVHEFLTDQDQITQYTLDCTVAIKGAEQVSRLGQTIPAIRFEELCRGEGLTLTNVYWMDASRRIVRSLQAVSPDAGYLQIDTF